MFLQNLLRDLDLSCLLHLMNWGKLWSFCWKPKTYVDLPQFPSKFSKKERELFSETIKQDGFVWYFWWHEKNRKIDKKTFMKNINVPKMSSSFLSKWGVIEKLKASKRERSFPNESDDFSKKWTVKQKIQSYFHGFNGGFKQPLVVAKANWFQQLTLVQKKTPDKNFDRINQTGSFPILWVWKTTKWQ